MKQTVYDLWALVKPKSIEQVDIRIEDLVEVQDNRIQTSIVDHLLQQIESLTDDKFIDIISHLDTLKYKRKYSRQMATNMIKVGNDWRTVPDGYVKNETNFCRQELDMFYKEQTELTRQAVLDMRVKFYNQQEKPWKSVQSNALLEGNVIHIDSDSHELEGRWPRDVVGVYRPTCGVCGGAMIGDGYSSVIHCEHVDTPEYVEVDSGPYFCEEPSSTNKLGKSNN